MRQKMLAPLRVSSFRIVGKVSMMEEMRDHKFKEMGFEMKDNNSCQSNPSGQMFKNDAHAMSTFYFLMLL